MSEKVTLEIQAIPERSHIFDPGKNINYIGAKVTHSFDPGKI
jgi:hypothetical protein